MDFIEKLQKAFRSHPLIFVSVVYAALFAIVSGIGKLESVRGFFSQALQFGTSIDDKGVLVAKYWFFLVLFGVVLALVAITALYIQSEVGRREAVRQKTERGTVAYKTLVGIMGAVSKIRDTHFPQPPNTYKCFKSVKIVVLISKDFDIEWQQEYEIYAVGKPVNVWGVLLEANDAAPAMDYLDDLNFKATDTSGSEVTYLPTMNDGRKKDVLFYFLPQIEPGGAPRKIEFSYKWPKMAKQIQDTGLEEFSWTISSQTQVEALEFHVYLEPGTGGNLVCDHAGPKYGAAKPKATPHILLKWPGYVYRVENAPAGRHRYALNVRHKRP